MSMTKHNIDKFSFAQMTSNSDGKTSSSGVMGSITAFAGVLAFIYGVIDYSFISKTGTIMTQAIIVITIGTGLLGYRKSQIIKDSNLTIETNTELPKDDTNQNG